MKGACGVWCAAAIVAVIGMVLGCEGKSAGGDAVGSASSTGATAGTPGGNEATGSVGDAAGDAAAVSDAGAEVSQDDPDGETPAPCDPACGEHGECIGAACQCADGWSGTICDACSAARFGPDCAPCECHNGTCNEGVEGDGACTCDSGFGGPTCDEPIGIPFDGEGPYGMGIMETAPNFTVETLDAPFNLGNAWTGLDSFVFIFRYSGSTYNTDVWNSDVKALLQDSPPNVHYLFGSFADDPLPDVEAMRVRVDEALAAMPAVSAANWEGRLHYISAPAGELQFVNALERFWFAIDRYQRWREIGSLYDWPSSSYPIRHIANEPTYFNFEVDLNEKMEALGATEVVLWDQGTHAGGWGGGHHTDVEIELPDPDAIAAYDSLSVFLYTACPDHLQGKDNGCNEWDYIQRLSVCSKAEAPNADAETACTPGESLACSCIDPGTGVRESSQSCNEEGTGFSDCACGCGTELVRWVTPYAREGKWLTDVSALLPLIGMGGKWTFRFSGANGYTIDCKLLLSNQEKGTRPIGLQPLWGKTGGTSFNEAYNDGKHADVAFTLPEGATGAAIAAVISGHGHSSTVENCAEFCNHQHEFSVNAGTPYLKDHPVAGTAYGCRDQISDGTVPNQFGTWVFGRGGWCAGLDIPPWVVDISDSLVDGENTVSYRGLFQGLDYTPTVNDPNGYLPEIKMASWLVYYGP